MNVADFIAGIDSDTVSAPVYLFCPGKPPRARAATYEPFLVERALELFVNKAVDPASKEFAYAAYYADETSVESIVMEAQTLPFLAERRVVVVRNAERYLSESNAGSLLRYLADPNTATVLLMVTDRVDKRTKFFKACGKAGEIVESPELSEAEARNWARDEVESRDRAIARDALEELVRRAGNHLSDVANAITILINFLGDDAKEITVETVVSASADVAEEEVWALTDAIAASQPGLALASLRRLTDLGKHPDELLGTINWLLKNAYAVAAADGSPPISRFVAQKVTPLATKLGARKLRDAFALCTDTQFMMRNTGTDAVLALELLVVKLAYPRARRKSA